MSFMVAVLNDGVTMDDPQTMKGEWLVKHGGLSRIDAQEKLRDCEDAAPECKWAIMREPETVGRMKRKEAIKLRHPVTTHALADRLKEQPDMPVVIFVWGDTSVYRVAMEGPMQGKIAGASTPVMMLKPGFLSPVTLERVFGFS